MGDRAAAGPLAVDTPLTPGARAAIQRRRAVEFRHLRLITGTLLVMAAILGLMYLAGPVLLANAGPDIRVVAILFGCWLLLLGSLAYVVHGYRWIQFARDLRGQTCVRLRCELRPCWLVRDSEDLVPYPVQRFRARGLRGVLTAPAEYHEAFGPPREAEITFARHSLVLISVDDEPVWTDSDAGAAPA